MYGGNSLYQYLERLSAQLHSQLDRIAFLEEILQRLEEDIASIRQQKQIVVEKIEYNFDQLKIEQLEGTLNIGITPGSLEGFKELAVNGAPLDVRQQPLPGLYQEIRGSIHQYLNEEVPDAIRKYETRNHRVLDETVRTHVIQDLKKQVDGRIQYYLSQVPQDQLQERPGETGEEIKRKVKDDIHVAIETFIKNLPGRE